MTSTFGTPWTIVHWVPLSMEFPRQEYWNALSKSAAAAKLLQPSLTLCDPIDGSPPGSPVPGILQARTLEWVAISISNAWKCKVKVKSLSRVRLFATPWTAAHQASPSMGFSRQEYRSGGPLPSPCQSLLYCKWKFKCISVSYISLCARHFTVVKCALCFILFFFYINSEWLKQ